MDVLISFLQSGLSAVIPFIVLLGLLVFVHEFGHFAVAKLCGVRVEVFSLGFGKKLFSKKRGDTTYCISLIPLGGYVKMFGDEQGSSVDESQRKYSFLHKTVWQRIAIVLAGPLMNFFFAILIFFVITLMGEEARTPKIGDIETGTVAFDAGFRSGDEVLSVNGQSITTWDDYQKHLNEQSNKTIRISVKREGSEQQVELNVATQLIPNPNILSLDEMTNEIEGLQFYSRASTVGVKPKSLAKELGLKTGDRIVNINGRKISYFREIEPSLIPFQNQEIDISVTRPEDNYVAEFKIHSKLGSFASIATLGIESPDLYLDKVQKGSPAEAVGLLAGDRLIKINEVTPQRWDDVLKSIKGFNGEGEVKVSVLRDSEEKSFSITPKMTTQMTQQGIEEKRFTIGIIPLVMMAPPSTFHLPSKGVMHSLVRGTNKTLDITAMTVVSFLRLIQNKISPKNIGGVISIGQAASESYKIGISHFLQMMAILSVHLFILNLLPIPVLDGGHLLFYSIEALRGAPVSMRKMEIAQQVGLVVLMSLMAFALFNDFSRLLGFW